MYYTFFFLLLFLSGKAAAQFSITTTDIEKRQPLDSVIVRNLFTGESALTGPQGKADLNWTLPVRIQVFKPSWESKTFNITQAGKNYDISLAPLNVQLREVTVQAYEQSRPPEQVPGSIQRLSASEIGRFDQTSLLSSVNVIPGVRVEERSPGSYRVSIRGSSIRSPFGVRNVKIYWNGMPLTEPGGDTQLNFLDLVNIDQLEVIKGPAGSIYGAGTGGAILLETDTDLNTSEAGYLRGSFGLQRAYAKVNTGTPKNKYGFRFAHQESDGYRDHSAFERQTAQLSTEHELSEERLLNINLLYTNLFYQIPGGLNPAQYLENPKQARPGSAKSEAAINYDAFTTAITHDMQYRNWSNKTTLYTYLHYFDHPFNNDYKKESTLAGGGRTVFQSRFWTGNVNTTLTAGAEYQVQQRAAQNFGNVNGQADTLNFSDEILSTQYLLFSQADLEFPGDWLITGGLSYNRLGYNLNRLYDATLENLGAVSTSFKPDLAARIGLVKAISPALNLHASLSQGFSPPGLREFRTNEGSINTSLEPERGTNYELGIRGRLFRNRLYYDLTAFHFRLDQTIVSYQDPSGVVLFRNAGATRQNGFELWADYLLLEEKNGFIRQLRFRQSYTYHRFKYKEYEQRGQDFSDNKMPGVAPHTFVSSVCLETSPGVNIQTDLQRVSDIPLNDANDVFADSYLLLKLKIGYRLPFRNFNTEIFAGSDNLLNEVYSLGNDINPEWGNRYYQPAPARSYFAGVRFRW